MSRASKRPGSKGATVKRLDVREVKELEEFEQPKARFHRVSTRSTIKTPVEDESEQSSKLTGNVLLDDSFEDIQANLADDPEEIETDDPRDEKAAEHLLDFHPRALEPGAGFFRSDDTKKYAHTLGADEWETVHKRVVILGIQMAKTARIRSEKRKRQLNQKNVFHEDANVVRAETQLAIELRREIKYSQLESLVLEEMLQREKMKFASNAEKNEAELQETFHRRGKRNASVNVSSRPNSPINESGRGRPGSPESSNSRPQSPLLPSSSRSRPSSALNNQGSVGVSSSGSKRSDRSSQAVNTSENKLEDEEGRALEDEAIEEEEVEEEGKLLSFEEYKEKVAARRANRRTPSMTSNKVEASCVEIEDYIKARALGFRGDKVRLKVPRAGERIGRNKEKKTVGGGSPQPKQTRGASLNKMESIDVLEISTEDFPDHVQFSDQSEDDNFQNLLSPSLGQKHIRSPKNDHVPTYLSAIEEIFEILNMTPANKLDFLLKYSTPEHVMSLADSLEEWKEVASLIRFFERVIVKLNQAKEKRIDSSNSFSEEEVERLTELNCYISMAQMFGATCDKWIEAILTKLSAICEERIKGLESTWGVTVYYRGHGYFKSRFPKEDPSAAARDNERAIKPLRYTSSAALIRLNKLLLFE